jgi:hypothetical protein
MTSLPQPLMPQNFITVGVGSHIVSTETKPVVILNIFLLVHVNAEQIYTTGLDITKDNKTIFYGVYIAVIPNTTHELEYLNFLTDVDMINSVIERVKSTLALTDDKILFTIAPTTRPKEKAMPKDMVS